MSNNEEPNIMDMFKDILPSSERDEELSKLAKKKLLEELSKSPSSINPRLVTALYQVYKGG